MDFIKSMIFCCNPWFFMKSKYEQVPLTNVEEMDNDEYKLYEEPDHKKVKYLNYKFYFEINDTQFFCKHIECITKVNYDNLKLSYLSRQNRRKKEFLTIMGNDSYKCFEFVCIKGDSISFQFKLHFNIEIYVANKNVITKFVNDEIVTIDNIDNIVHIYWKFMDNQNMFIDLLSQSCKWFSQFMINDENILNMSDIFSNKYGLLLGVIKPLINPLTIN